MEFAPRALDFGFCSSQSNVGATAPRGPHDYWRDSGLPDATTDHIQLDALGFCRVGRSTLPYSCLYPERTSPYALAI